MNDNRNINDLKHEQSWQKAEKMLDRHFRKRRIIMWSVSIFIAGLVIFSSTLFVSKFSRNDSSIGKNVASNQPINLSPERKTDRVFSSEKNVATAKSKGHPNEVNVSAEEKVSITESVNHNVEKGNDIKEPVTNKTNIPVNEKVNETNSENSIVEQRRIARKTSSSKPTALVANTNPLRTDLKNSEMKYSEVKTFESNSQNSNVNEDSKTDHSPVFSWPDLVLIDPIHVSQIPFADGGGFSPVSRSEDKSITLPPKKFDLKLSVYGAAHYVFKNLGSNDFTEYINRRKKEEEGIVTASMGASLSHAVKDFSISIGFEYSTWGEKNLYLPYLNKKSTVENGHYQDFNQVTVDTVFIWGNQWFIYDTIPDSTFISHLDTITKSEYDASVYGANSINRFYFFEVPVEISYRFSHSKIGIGATVGISPAWLITKKGYYLNKDVSGVELISDIKSVNTFIVNGRFSLDLYYKMNKRINMVLRPQFKANLNSIFKNEYHVSQRYYATGLVFGLQYSIR